MGICIFLGQLRQQFLNFVVSINLLQSVVDIHRKCHWHNALRLQSRHCARANFGCDNVLTIRKLTDVFLHCRHGVLAVLTYGAYGAFFHKNPFVNQILINVEIIRPTKVSINGIAVCRCHRDPENCPVMRGRMCHWLQKLVNKLPWKIPTCRVRQQRRRGNGCNDGTRR